jgi:predicted protein tyrosine phosphatase
MAQLLQEQGHEAMCAGVDPDAPSPVTQEMLDWADVILGARDAHIDVLKERFAVHKPALFLDIQNGGFYSQEMRRQVEEQLKGLRLPKVVSR